jgi:hypothetical protein
VLDWAALTERLFGSATDLSEADKTNVDVLPHFERENLSKLAFCLLGTLAFDPLQPVSDSVDMGIHSYSFYLALCDL